jgi:thiol-disulfide isomerase/thioredoxin
MRLIFLCAALCLSACTTSATAKGEKPREAICLNLPVGDYCAYDPNRDAKADLATAMAIAAENDQKTLLVMGADWCHDSRALAGHLRKERFTPLIAEHYRLVYVDVAQKNRNIDIAQRFGFNRIVGTPTVIILDSDGTVLNRREAPTWRNAASRSEDDIYTYFETYAAKE